MSLITAVTVSFLLRVDHALQVCRRDIPAMQQPADEMAARLIKGGHMFAAGQPSWINEMTGRAGGFMMLEPLGDRTPTETDVVLYAQQSDEPLPQPIRDSKGRVVAFGKGESSPGVTWFSNHTQECGIASSLANAVPGWLFTGELVAALTRQGKMPMMWESIGTYTGAVRGEALRKAGGRLHEDLKVSPIAPGVLANRYCDAVSAMLKRVEAEERLQLDQAGQWSADAKDHGKRLIMYSMGHMFPDAIGKTDIGKVFESYVWNAGFRVAQAPDHQYGPGDTLIHIGYQHPPSSLLRKAVPAGARVAYVCITRDRDYVNNPNVVWVDPMWNWEDACVAVEGYEIPILPASGVVNGAIAWEIYRLTGERLHPQAAAATK